MYNEYVSNWASLNDRHLAKLICDSAYEFLNDGHRGSTHVWAKTFLVICPKAAKCSTGYKDIK